MEEDRAFITGSWHAEFPKSDAEDYDESEFDPVSMAYGLIAKSNQLEYRILMELLGEPKRYSELKPQLQGKADNNLTVALKRLEEQGLVERKVAVQEKPPTARYKITPMGIETILATQSIRPIQDHLKSIQRVLDEMANERFGGFLSEKSLKHRAISIFIEPTTVGPMHPLIVTETNFAGRLGLPIRPSRSALAGHLESTPEPHLDALISRWLEKERKRRPEPALEQYR